MGLGRYGTRYTMTAGMGLIGAAFLVLTNVHAGTDYWVIALVGIGAGSGCAMTAASEVIMSSAPAETAGGAAGIEETSYELGDGLSVVIMGSKDTDEPREAAEKEASLPDQPDHPAARSTRTRSTWAIPARRNRQGDDAHPPARVRLRYRREAPAGVAAPRANGRQNRTMGRLYEVDGYTAELDDDLRIVHRNRRGRQLQQIPDWLADSEELRPLYRLRQTLRVHRRRTREQAEAWAAAGTRVPAALAEADPLWGEALGEAGVGTVAEPSAPDDGEPALTARTYGHPDGHSITVLLPARFARHWDALLETKENWALTDTFATGLPAPDDAELRFPDRLMAANPGQEQEALEAAHEFGWSLWTVPPVHKPFVDDRVKHFAATASGYLPPFLDELADMALRTTDKSAQYASEYFTGARKAERDQHAGPDEAWLDDRYATFADRGALAVGAVRARAKELAPRGASVDPDRLHRFRDILARRVHTPEDLYPGMIADLRKVAKAAGADPDSEVAALLQEIVAKVGLCAGDADKFWSDALKGKALELLVERRPETVDDVLRLAPGDPPGGEEWVALLRRSGALALLTGERPGLPAGETARLLHGWLVSEPLGRRRSDAFYDLAVSLAPRLAADAVPLCLPYDARTPGQWPPLPLDLADELLELGVPLADPPPELGKRGVCGMLVHRRPQLARLIDDPRFGPELRRALEGELERAELGDGGRRRYHHWYRPQEPREPHSWRHTPGFCLTPLGRDVLRGWLDRQRARVRAGVDLDGLVHVIAPFVYMGGAADDVLKDEAAARDFASVDVVALVLADLPVEADRSAVEAQMATMRPAHLMRWTGPALRGWLEGSIPGLSDEQLAQAWEILQTGVNCQEGLRRLAGRLSV